MEELKPDQFLDPQIDAIRVIIFICEDRVEVISMLVSFNIWLVSCGRGKREMI